MLKLLNLVSKTVLVISIAILTFMTVGSFMFSEISGGSLLSYINTRNILTVAVVLIFAYIYIYIYAKK
jgi:hypothetical protein